MESSEPEAKKSERDAKKILLMQRVALKDAAGEIFREGVEIDPKNLESTAL